MNKKIIGISDGTHLIPVSWKLNAGVADTDVPLHNAIIMGAVMARKIDVMRLWDGTINISEKFGLTDSSIGTINSTIANISETAIAISQYGNNSAIACVIPPINSDISDLESTVSTPIITEKIITEDI